MNLRVLGGYGSVGVCQRPSAFLINDRTLSTPAPSPGALTVPEQFAIEHAAHLALASRPHRGARLPGRDPGPRVEAARPCHRRASLEPVVDTLRASVFNNVVWPDFAALPPARTRARRIRAWRRAASSAWAMCGSRPSRSITPFRPAASSSTTATRGSSTPPTPVPRVAIWQAARELHGLGGRHPRMLVSEPAGEAGRGGQAHDAPAYRARAGQASARCTRLDLPHQGARSTTKPPRSCRASTEPRRLVLLEQDKTYTL